MTPDGPFQAETAVRNRKLTGKSSVCADESFDRWLPNDIHDFKLFSYPIFANGSHLMGTTVIPIRSGNQRREHRPIGNILTGLLLKTLE